MKRIIIASICSLAVSFFGIFGSNQISVNDNKLLEKVSIEPKLKFRYQKKGSK